MNKKMNKSARIVGSAIAIIFLLLMVGHSYERIAESRDLKQFPPPGQLVDVGERKLHVNCQGTGEPTVVIETGAGQFSFHWRSVQDAVAKSVRVCVYDRAGFGWSDPAPAGRSIEDRATELHALLAKANITPPYVVVGHSYGGLVAREFVRANFNDVVGVVLVDAAEEEFVFSPEFEQLSSNARTQIRNFEFLRRFGVARVMLAMMSDEKVAAQMRVPHDLIERVGLTAAGLSPGFFNEYGDELASYALTQTTRRHAGGFGKLGNRPLIVIQRGRPVDGSSPALEKNWADAQERLAMLSSRSELVVARNSGHDIYADEPEIVIGAIQKILRDSQLTAK